MTRSGTFRWESELVKSLLPAVAKMSPGPRDLSVVTEVPCPSGGIPDIVGVLLDAAAIERREASGLGAVTNPHEAVILSRLSEGEATLTELANVVFLSREHLRRSILPRLISAGWIAPLQGRGESASTMLLVQYEDVAQWVVTVEAKLTDWRGGMSQALRHAPSADAAYLALDARFSRRVTLQASAASERGVGILTVDASTGAVEERSTPVRWQTQNVLRRILAERVWTQLRSDHVPGHNALVFGRDLGALALAG